MSNFMINKVLQNEYESLMRLDFGNKFICSDCTQENFATGKWILYGGTECDFCNKRTICRKIDCKLDNSK